MGFITFVEKWSQNQYSKCAPSVHNDVARWLEEQIAIDSKKLALLAFRGMGKSTIAGLLCVWMLLRNPRLRIMILSAEQGLSDKMVHFIRNVIERHPDTAGLKPDNPQHWSASAITVKRDTSLRDPSVISKSIIGNYTGCRAEVIVFDDVEVPNTCNTRRKRADLRRRILEAQYVLFDDKLQLYLGTPHHEDSIYMGAGFVLDGFAVKKVPLLDDDDNVVWSNVMTSEQIKLVRHTAYFKSQMLLEPAIENPRIDTDSIKQYDHEIIHHQHGGVIGGEEIAMCSAWLDLAYGESENSDKTAVAIIVKDRSGNFYIHDLRYVKAEKPSDNQDEATLMCSKVIDILSLYQISQIRIETNGLGKFIPSIMRVVSKRRGYALSIIPVHQTINKDSRILNAMDWCIATGRLYIHKRLQGSEVMTEIKYWRPGGGCHDDGIDAISSCILHFSGVPSLVSQAT